MIRMRGVKPDLLRHESLCDLEASCGLPLRLCFIGLFMAADRRGRFEWRPRSLKAALMPFDDGLDFGAVLDQLSAGDFVRRYTIDGKDYGWIPGFTRHQSFNNKEQDSVFPPHPDEPRDSGTEDPQKPRVTHASATRESRDLEPSSRDLEASPRDLGKGKERKEKGKEVNTAESSHSSALAERTSDDSWEGQQLANLKAADKIASAYRKPGGSQAVAIAAIVRALEAGQDPAEMLRAVEAHERFRSTLPRSNYHPGREKFFESEAWRCKPADVFQTSMFQDTGGEPEKNSAAAPVPERRGPVAPAQWQTLYAEEMDVAPASVPQGWHLVPADIQRRLVATAERRAAA